VAPWVGLAAVLGTMQLASYLQHPRADHPTLVVLAGWLWLGWHVFVRVDWQ
jgi:hypothetical protein